MLQRELKLQVRRIGADDDPLRIEMPLAAKRPRGEMAARFACGACGDVLSTHPLLDAHIADAHAAAEGALELLLPHAYGEHTNISAPGTRKGNIIADFVDLKAGLERSARMLFELAKQNRNDLKKVYRCQTLVHNHKSNIIRCCPARIFTEQRAEGLHVRAYTKHFGHPYNKFTISKDFLKFLIPTNHREKIQNILELVLKRIAELPEKSLGQVACKALELERCVARELEKLDVVPEVVIIPEVKVNDSDSEQESAAVPNTRKRKLPSDAADKESVQTEIADEAKRAVDKALQEYMRSKAALTPASVDTDTKISPNSGINVTPKSIQNIKTRTSARTPVHTNKSPVVTSTPLPKKDIKVVIEKTPDVKAHIAPKIVNTFSLNEQTEIDSLVKDVEMLVNDGKGFKDEFLAVVKEESDVKVEDDVVTNGGEIVPPAGIESKEKYVSMKVKDDNKTVQDILKDLEQKSKQKAKIEDLCPTPSFSESYASFIQKTFPESQRNKPVTKRRRRNSPNPTIPDSFILQMVDKTPKNTANKKENTNNKKEHTIKSNGDNAKLGNFKKNDLLVEKRNRKKMNLTHPLPDDKIIDEPSFLKLRSKTKWQEIPKSGKTKKFQGVKSRPTSLPSKKVKMDSSVKQERSKFDSRDVKAKRAMKKDTVDIMSDLDVADDGDLEESVGSVTLGKAVKEKFIVKEQPNDCNILIIRM